MRIGTVQTKQLPATHRIDCKFFLDEGYSAFRRIRRGSLKLLRAGDVFGDENIWMPTRFKRVYARSAEFGKPILVPYDCFRYVPWSDAYLSRSQVEEYASAEVKRGWLLMTRSGRNLGPMTLVDSCLERFTVSDDMVRISVDVCDELLYFTGFMQTPTGQAIIRRDRNGSVIDHLAPEQVAALEYPVVRSPIRKQVIEGIRKGFELRESARARMEKVRQQFEEYLRLDDHSVSLSAAERSRRYVVERGRIVDRFDSEPFAPTYDAYRNRIQATGFARRLVDIAKVHKPPGRYKTVYVAEEQHGLRLLSGRQIAQYRPIALKIISPRALPKPSNYLLESGMVLLTADGRAEENLADCVLVLQDRTGWTASGHVHRLIPRKGVHSGLLYLACSCRPTQDLLKSLATGSVVDALSQDDVASMVVPYPEDKRGLEMGKEALAAWQTFVRASEAEDEAISALEAELS